MFVMPAESYDPPLSGVRLNAGDLFAGRYEVHEVLGEGGAGVVYGAFCASVSRGWLAAIPAAAVLFTLGRILFAAGYRRGAPGRALGFALTFYSTVALAVLAFVGLVLRLLGP